MEDLYFLDLDTKTIDPNLPKDAKLYSWVVINVECSLTENSCGWKYGRNKMKFLLSGHLTCS